MAQNTSKHPSASTVKKGVEETAFGMLTLSGFAVLCAIAIAVLQRYGSVKVELLSFLDLGLLGLACLRLIHLVTYDRIFIPVRERLAAKRRAWAQFMSNFIGCIWCTGMWSALLVVTLYFLGTWGRFIVLVLAVAALGTLLQVVSKAIAAREGTQ